jgi:hypothetical protein
MDSQIITEQMPPGNSVVKLVKVFISINLIFTYAISINPTNTIVQAWIFDKSAKPNDTTT